VSRKQDQDTAKTNAYKFFFERAKCHYTVAVNRKICLWLQGLTSVLVMFLLALRTFPQFISLYIFKFILLRVNNIFTFIN
jgi:hypothetical protein